MIHYDLREVMEILSSKSGEFKIKGKKAGITIDSKAMIGEFVLPGPGEYEVAGVDAVGLKDGVYKFKIDGVKVCFLPRKLNENEKDVVGSVDILITAAVNGFDTSLDASYVIPYGPEEDVSKFAKDAGSENLAAQPKLVTSADKLPETTTVVILG
ncbi:hypothetical protein HY310_00480 [Candidatus Microgenomates bacterium]|nr:hypothetical protein [Candidatus Microgenomates bacterium]